MVRLIFILLCIFAAFLLLKKRYLFRIEIRDNRPNLKGEIPGRSWTEIRDFLNELGLPNRSRITAYRDDRGFRLSFNDVVSESKRQRIRNYLYLGL